jgi:hypothetical protein
MAWGGCRITGRHGGAGAPGLAPALVLAALRHTGPVRAALLRVTFHIVLHRLLFLQGGQHQVTGQAHCILHS